MNIKFYWGRRNEETVSAFEKQPKKESWIERDDPKNYINYCSDKNLDTIYIPQRNYSELVPIFSLNLSEKDLISHEISSQDHSLITFKGIESFSHEMSLSALEQYAKSLNQFHTFLYTDFAKQFMEHHSADVHVHIARYTISLYQREFAFNPTVEYENLDKTKIIFSSKKLNLDEVLSNKMMRMHGNYTRNIELSHIGVYELPFGLVNREINWLFLDK